MAVQALLDIHKGSCAQNNKQGNGHTDEHERRKTPAARPGGLKTRRGSTWRARSCECLHRHHFFLARVGQPKIRYRESNPSCAATRVGLCTPFTWVPVA